MSSAGASYIGHSEGKSTGPMGILAADEGHALDNDTDAVVLRQASGSLVTEQASSQGGHEMLAPPSAPGHKLLAEPEGPREDTEGQVFEGPVASAELQLEAPSPVPPLERLQVPPATEAVPDEAPRRHQTGWPRFMESLADVLGCGLGGCCMWGGLFSS